MTFTPSRPDTRRSLAGPALWGARVCALGSVLALLALFVTAGTLVAPGEGLEALHGTAAIALHVLTGLTAVAAGIVWLEGSDAAARVPLWPAILGLVVFAASFVQSGLGTTDLLVAHVTGALLLTVGAVWLLVWSVATGRDDVAPARPAWR